MKSFAVLALAGLAAAQFNGLPTCAVRAFVVPLLSLLRCLTLLAPSHSLPLY